MKTFTLTVSNKTSKHNDNIKKTLHRLKTEGKAITFIQNEQIKKMGIEYTNSTIHFTTK